MQKYIKFEVELNTTRSDTDHALLEERCSELLSSSVEAQNLAGAVLFLEQQGFDGIEILRLDLESKLEKLLREEGVISREHGEYFENITYSVFNPSPSSLLTSPLTISFTL